MLPILFRIIAVSLGGVIIKELLSSNEKKYNDMSNCHNHFLGLEKDFSLTPTKKTKLIDSRKALEKRIRDYFAWNHNFLMPKFYIQGSYKMKTMVRDRNGEYDVDLGIYFLERPSILPYTLQSYVWNAVNGHTDTPPEHRNKCVRVIYKGDFDIDLPVYYMTRYDRHPCLATKNGWEQSDPKELCDWFKNQRRYKGNGGQLLRVIKYFKIWTNARAGKMPSGIAFTIWVTNNFQSNQRDDIAFYETAKAIRNSIRWNVSSINPATPYDDFTSKLDYVQKSNFKTALDNLIREADKALYQPDLRTALNIWGRQFGVNFL
ncbi:MAG: nucleotidyltransferase [Gelidibacter sp.]|nr:nucleotidyltransferase [Saprospiraceae bacterium]